MVDFFSGGFHKNLVVLKENYFEFWGEKLFLDFFFLVKTAKKLGPRGQGPQVRAQVTGGPTHFWGL